MLTVSIKVIPRASSAVVRALRIKVTAVPANGEANEEAREVLAAYFKVPKGNVEVVSRHSARQKRIRITL